MKQQKQDVVVKYNRWPSNEHAVLRITRLYNGLHSPIENLRVAESFENYFQT